MKITDQFDLTGRVAIITGGAGLLGSKHAESIASAGGIPVLLDLYQDKAEQAAADIEARYAVDALGLQVDITQESALRAVQDQILERYGRVDILINNAANNPKVEDQAGSGTHWSHLETFPLAAWDADIAVGVTGAFLCSRVFGSTMAQNQRGVILNIASDLGVIGPDQRIYRQPGLPDEAQMVKPVTYSVVKHALIGLTRYLATYWAEDNVRVNAISPGGVFAGQDEAFVQRLTNLIPMGRMANVNEYQAAILFLVSDASSYMTGSNLIIDGGRTSW